MHMYMHTYTHAYMRHRVWLEVRRLKIFLIRNIINTLTSLICYIFAHHDYMYFANQSDKCFTLR